MNKQTPASAWWAFRRDRTLETRRPDLYDLYLDADIALGMRQADSLRMFQLIYDAAENAEERADVVDEYIDYIPWQTSPKFIAWMRERSRYDGEVIRLLDVYGFPLHDD